MTEGRPEPLAVGQQFLKYEIVARIGRGGHACVYHGHDKFLDRHVAIKVLYRPDGVSPDMFRRGQTEAKLLCKLRHPNLVEVIDAGVTDQGLMYIVMELLRGRTMRGALEELGKLEVHEALDLAEQIAEGVHAAHEAGAIHRDLKPDNVFVLENNRAKVLDFGIAKVVSGSSWTTQRDLVLGTMSYISPEQLRGTKVTACSDVYALGTMLYEALLGTHPLLVGAEERTMTIWELSYRQAMQVPPPLHQLDASIPEYVALLVDRAVTKLPRQRFATMAEFRDSIREAKQRHAGEQAQAGRRLPIRDLARSQTKVPPREEHPSPPARPSNHRVMPRRELPQATITRDAESTIRPSVRSIEPPPSPPAASPRLARAARETLRLGSLLPGSPPTDGGELPAPGFGHTLRIELPTLPETPEVCSRDEAALTQPKPVTPPQCEPVAPPQPEPIRSGDPEPIALTEPESMPKRQLEPVAPAQPESIHSGPLEPVIPTQPEPIALAQPEWRASIAESVPRAPAKRVSIGLRTSAALPQARPSVDRSPAKTRPSPSPPHSASPRRTLAGTPTTLPPVMTPVRQQPRPPRAAEARQRAPRGLVVFGGIVTGIALSVAFLTSLNHMPGAEQAPPVVPTPAQDTVPPGFRPVGAAQPMNEGRPTPPSPPGASPEPASTPAAPRPASVASSSGSPPAPAKPRATATPQGPAKKPSTAAPPATAVPPATSTAPASATAQSTPKRSARKSAPKPVQSAQNLNELPWGLDVPPQRRKPIW